MIVDSLSSTGSKIEESSVLCGTHDGRWKFPIPWDCSLDAVPLSRDRASLLFSPARLRRSSHSAGGGSLAVRPRRAGEHLFYRHRLDGLYPVGGCSRLFHSRQIAPEDLPAGICLDGPVLDPAVAHF